MWPSSGWLTSLKGVLDVVDLHLRSGHPENTLVLQTWGEEIRIINTSVYLHINLNAETHRVSWCSGCSSPPAMVWLWLNPVYTQTQPSSASANHIFEAKLLRCNTSDSQAWSRESDKNSQEIKSTWCLLWEFFRPRLKWAQRRESYGANWGGGRWGNTCY